MRALRWGGVLLVGWLALRLPAAWSDAAGLATDWRQAIRLAEMPPSGPRQAARTEMAARETPAAVRDSGATVRSPVPGSQSAPPAAPALAVLADAATLAVLADAATLAGAPVLAAMPPAAAPLAPAVLPAEAGLPPLRDAQPLRPPEALAAWFQPRSLPAIPDVLIDHPDREPPSAEAFALASEAYARLAVGERRRAARLLDAALLAGPHPNADGWRRQREAMRRRWSGDVYALTRAPGPVSAAAAPLLGGGQSGSTLAFTLDPLARSPLAVVVRNSAATDAPALTAQAAVGLRWQFRPGLSVSAERLIALGALARNGWTLRLAGGRSGRLPGRLRRIEWQAYAEAGVIDDGNGYGGVEARAALPLLRLGKGRLLAGAGAWGGAQTGIEAAYRADVGPTLGWQRPVGRSTLTINADWRFRVTGNAFPESGPALTVAASF